VVRSVIFHFFTDISTITANLTKQIPSESTSIFSIVQTSLAKSTKFNEMQASQKHSTIEQQLNT